MSSSPPPHKHVSKICFNFVKTKVTNPTSQQNYPRPWTEGGLFVSIYIAEYNRIRLEGGVSYHRKCGVGKEMTGLHYFTDVDVVNKLLCGDVVVVNIHYHPTRSGATVFQIMVDSNK